MTVVNLIISQSQETKDRIVGANESISRHHGRPVLQQRTDMQLLVERNNFGGQWESVEKGNKHNVYIMPNLGKELP
jgi:glutamine amidotransferase PdxT